MATDAVTLIMNDHRLLESLFQRLQAGEGDRQALLAEVEARLTAHSRAEEREVYPAIKKTDAVEADEVDEAYHEHEEAMQLLTQAKERMDAPEFEAAFTEFVDAVTHHVEEEETDVLPALEEAVDAKTLDRLGEAFERVRAEELSNLGVGADAGGAGGSEARSGAAGGSRGRSGGGGGGGKEAKRGAGTEASREELYEKAKKADIAGRSKMSKEELAEALREMR
jgi:hemerythrin superfamily protein